MNLHEFQAKQLLQRYGLAVPNGQVVQSAEAAAAATKEIAGDAWVVKAQVHAGGRGKAGGVKIVKSASEAQSVAYGLLGKSLVTYQNAPDGQPVHQLLVEQTLPIARELYLSVLVDRSLERVVMVASSAGGMDIEEIAATHPEQILQEICDP
ncbi:MAG: ATP-grasp domain-containing protein, partial [Candidatus Methylopumilus sp.]